MLNTHACFILQLVKTKNSHTQSICSRFVIPISTLGVKSAVLRRGTLGKIQNWRNYLKNISFSQSI